MTDYRVTYIVRNVEDFEKLAQQVYASLYLAEIEGEVVRLHELGYAGGRIAAGTIAASDLAIPSDQIGKDLDVTSGDDGFSYPATQKLLKHLNETNVASGEGDWTLYNDDKVGED